MVLGRHPQNLEKCRKNCKYLNGYLVVVLPYSFIPSFREVFRTVLSDKFLTFESFSFHPITTECNQRIHYFLELKE